MSDTLIAVPPFVLGEADRNAAPTVGVAAGGRRWRITWVVSAGGRVQTTTPFGADEWSKAVPLQPDDEVELSPAITSLPDGILAWSAQGSTKIALRTGRRQTGMAAAFPGAGLIICRQTNAGWEDMAFADDTPDAEIFSAAIGVVADEIVAAYVVTGGRGEVVCRGLRLALTESVRPTGRWRQLPDYPLAPGMAAAIAGVHEGTLIAGGGANFPDQPPWENGIKRTYHELFVLQPGAANWSPAGRLPEPRAYAAVVSVADGVLVIGGENASGLFSDAFFLRWNGREVVSVPAPSLPVALTCATAVVLDGKVYLAGGYEQRSARVSTGNFLCLDLNHLARGWRTLPSWPGPSRALSVVAALQGSLYLISGLEMSVAEDGQTRMNYLADAYRYRPTGEWERLPDLPWSTVAAPSPAPVTTTPARVYVCGGVDGRQVGKVPRDRRVPGDIIYFDVAQNQWRLCPQRWPDPVVCSSPVPSGTEWILVSGEIMAGKRTVAVRVWQPGS